MRLRGVFAVFFGGDLQAQCTATAYAVRDAARPFIGLYGACSTLSLALRRIAPHRLGWPRPPARLLLALPLTLLRETALTAAALCRAASGREMRPGKIREIPVAQGNDPGSLTRRGLSILRLSLAPNGYVTDDSAQPGLWPLHQLVPRPVDGDETWPG